MILNYEKIFNSVDLQKLKNKQVLITGANGLIGGFLAEFFKYLNDEGWKKYYTPR